MNDEVQPLMNNTNESWLAEFRNFFCCCCTYTEDYENKDVKENRSSLSNNSNRNRSEKSNSVADSSRPIDRESMRAFKPISLMNVGATCYLNSAFQGISACDLFVEDIDELAKMYHTKIDQLEIFKELMDILNGCSQRRMNIARNPIFRNWNKPGQQDSYELLAYALNQVYNSIRTHKENAKEIKFRDLNHWLLVKLPMRCILKYTITCDCSAISYSPLQSDLALHVTIPIGRESSNLTDLVHEYFGVDPIEDFVCDIPDCKGRSAKRLARLREPVPKTLCIHLQRTYWNGYRMVKINKSVKFEPELKIKSEYIDFANEKFNSEKILQFKDEGNKEQINNPQGSGIHKEEKDATVCSIEIDVNESKISDEKNLMPQLEDKNDKRVYDTGEDKSLQEDNAEDKVVMAENDQNQNSENYDNGASIINQQESPSYAADNRGFTLTTTLEDSEKKVVDEEKSGYKTMSTNHPTPVEEGSDEGNAEKGDKDDDGANIIIQQEIGSSEAENCGFKEVTATLEDTEKKMVDEEKSAFSDIENESRDKTKSTNYPTSVEEVKAEKDDKDDDGANIIIQQESGSSAAENCGFKDVTATLEDTEKKVVDEEKSALSDVENESGYKTMSSNDPIPVEEGNDEGNEEKDDKDAQPDRTYTLVSVIVHSGSVDGGHYVCYKRICDKWFLTNDGYVKEVNDREVFGSQAYILFYEQRGDNN